MELFSILERLLPVRFTCNDQTGTEAVAEIIVGMAKRSAGVGSKNTPSLSVAPLPTTLASKASYPECEVTFSGEPEVPLPFRRRVVSTKLGAAGSVLSLGAEDKVLATSKQGPIWSVSERGAVKHFKSALPLPDGASDGGFSDAFNADRFLEMLVLLQFLREISSDTAYRNAPLRAGFIVDDPNLHWPRYGFVDYRQIAAHARRENYHVSFATIPIDTWFTHGATADLFRRSSQWLSLLVHGNNHAKMELAGSYSHATRTALLQQAIRRIERLEQKAGLSVCRVMVPPHGACSSDMLAELPRCGFESACISAGSLRAHNGDKSWTKTLGFSPSEVIEGCPVLPRWALTGNIRNTLLLAAYLGQPMILRGHHQDLKDGVEVFDAAAQFINGLGNVLWSNMTGLSRLNYSWRLEETTCRVKALGTTVAFELPTDATEVVVERVDSTDDSGWQATFSDGSVRRITPDEHVLVPAKLDRKILLQRTGSPRFPAATMGLRPTSAGLMLRRLLTEARDRFLVS